MLQLVLISGKTARSPECKFIKTPFIDKSQLLPIINLSELKFFFIGDITTPSVQVQLEDKKKSSISGKRTKYFSDHYIKGIVSVVNKYRPS